MNKMINGMSILQKILISFVIVIVIPLLLSLFMSVRTAEKLVMDNIYSNTESSVEIAATSLEGVIRQISHAVLYISTNESIREYLEGYSEEANQSNPEHRYQWIRLSDKVETLLTNTFLVNRTKLYVTVITPAGISYQNYSNSKGIITPQRLQHLNEKYSSNIGVSIHWMGFEDRETNELYDANVVTLLKSIEGTSGYTVGTLIVSISEDEITKLIAGKSGDVERVLLSGEKEIIASTNKEWLGKSFDSIIKGGIIKNQRYSKDEDFILTHKAIERTHWTIVDIKQVSEIKQQLGESTFKLFFVTMLCIVAFLAIATLIARRIAIPLKTLSKAMVSTDLSVTKLNFNQNSKNEINILENSFTIMKNNINNLIAENIEKEKMKRKVEMEALQAQISPHFLFNTLNTVRCAIENNRKEKASEVIRALVNLLRMTIVKGEALIPLEQEIDNIKNYVTILKMRHDINFEIYYDIPEIIKDYKVPKLLLQPIIENAILHGLMGITYIGEINVLCELDNENVIIVISDNGKGFVNSSKDNTSQKEIKISGIGITNVNQRIKLQYGEQYGLEIISEPEGGTVVQLILPGLNVMEKEEYD